MKVPHVAGVICGSERPQYHARTDEMTLSLTLGSCAPAVRPVAGDHPRITDKAKALKSEKGRGKGCGVAVFPYIRFLPDEHHRNGRSSQRRTKPDRT